MDEIGVDDAEIVTMIHGVKELLAHAHKGGGAAGRKIEPADELEPARLGNAMELGRVRGRGLNAPGRDRGIDATAIVAEGGRQRFEESDARPDSQLGIVGEDLVGERDARGLAAAGKQVLAKLNQAGRARARRLAALPPYQGAAPFGDALQHLAEKRAIHRIFRQPGAR